MEGRGGPHEAIHPKAERRCKLSIINTNAIEAVHEEIGTIV